MMRYSIVTVALLAAVAVSGGCRPSAANIALRKERQQLQQQVQELQTLRAGDLARIKALEGQQDRPATLSQDKLDRLYTAHGLSFGRLTGGYREPANASRDTGVVVHVVPTDQQGQTLKAAGSFNITVFDLSVPEKPLVGQRSFSLDEARAAWYGQALLFNYVLKVPFQSLPSSPRLLIRVEFNDELTGRTITADKEVTIKLE